MSESKENVMHLRTLAFHLATVALWSCLPSLAQADSPIRERDIGTSFGRDDSSCLERRSLRRSARILAALDRLPGFPRLERSNRRSRRPMARIVTT